MARTRATLLLGLIVVVLACGACTALIGLADVPSAFPDGGVGADQTAPTSDGGHDGAAVIADTGTDGTVTPDSGQDGATTILDAGPDSAQDAAVDGESADASDDGATSLLTNPIWAQWPIPNLDDSGLPNPQSFTIGTGKSAGTVGDNVTLLTWQQTPTGTDGGTYPLLDFAQATTYCADLTLAGDNDWRVPTLVELASIVDYNDYAPAINEAYFPGTPSGALDAGYSMDSYFWSTTPLRESPGYTWPVDFTVGQTAVVEDTSPTPEYVRCVRGGSGPFAVPAPANAPPGRYTIPDGGTGTVYDTKTKLTWQATSGGGSWLDAFTYCSSLSLNGGGWRLPSIGELQSIVDYSKDLTLGEPVIDLAFFPGTAATDYWSSTVLPPALAGGVQCGWVLIFDTGVASECPGGPSNSDWSVRCVR